MLRVNVYACMCVCVCGVKEDFKSEVSPVVVPAASTFKLVIINCPV